MAISQSGVSQRVMRILFNGLAKMFESFLYSVRCQFIEMVTAQQIETVSVGIVGKPAGQPALLRTGQVQTELLGNLFSNHRRHRQSLCQMANMLRTPDMRVVARVNQLDTDRQHLVMFGDAPSYDSLHFKIATQGGGTDILAPVMKGRVTRHHSQPRQLRQTVD